MPGDMPITDTHAEPADDAGARRRWGKAAVVGGGFAGLVTARVLADFFDEVLVLEQDELEENSGVHPHVPQGKHAHAMLAPVGLLAHGLLLSGPD